MGLHHDGLYQDPTWFDALGASCLRHCRRCLPRHRAYFWTTGFALFAALCVAWAAGLATHCAVYELPFNQCIAQLLAAGSLLVAAQHFLAATGMSARGTLPRKKLITRSQEAAAAVGSRSAPRTRTGSTACKQQPRFMPAEGNCAGPQQFFRAVKAAGINVRIAQALYAAGFRSGEQVRVCEDARLLAIPGIGQATLRKLRVQFGLYQIGAETHSNAA